MNILLIGLRNTDCTYPHHLKLGILNVSSSVASKGPTSRVQKTGFGLAIANNALKHSVYVIFLYSMRPPNFIEAWLDSRLTK